jgi:hypothetical protein
MTSPEPTRAEARARFRRTLVKVISVQVVTIVILWLVQSHYR